jgi:hypothetical protein
MAEDYWSTKYKWTGKRSLAAFAPTRFRPSSLASIASAHRFTPSQLRTLTLFVALSKNLFQQI